MAKLSLEALNDIDGFIAAALVDSESGLAMATLALASILNWLPLVILKCCALSAKLQKR